MRLSHVSRQNRRWPLFACAALLVGLSTSISHGQTETVESSAAPKLQEPKAETWEFGVNVFAAGSCAGIEATLPIPKDWPEQKVVVVSEEKSPQVKSIEFRDQDGVKQMLVSIPKLSAGETANAVLKLRIEKSWIEEPDETQSLVKPSKPGKALAKFLGESPYIETKDPKIRAVASEIGSDESDAWDQAKTIFFWVRENVKYKFAEKIKPAKDALRDKEGDCEELTSLFVALCRNNKIPARAVWVPGHCYPEFYLVDGQGEGHWFPCQAAGADPDFGRMPEDRPILQKGDSFRIPGSKKPVRYLQPTLTAKHAEASPQVSFIMQRVRATSPAASP